MSSLSDDTADGGNKLLKHSMSLAKSLGILDLGSDSGAGKLAAQQFINGAGGGMYALEHSPTALPDLQICEGSQPFNSPPAIDGPSVQPTLASLSTDFQKGVFKPPIGQAVGSPFAGNAFTESVSSFMQMPNFTGIPSAVLDFLNILFSEITDLLPQFDSIDLYNEAAAESLNLSKRL